MEIATRLVGVLLRILSVLLAPVFWLASRSKSRALPAIDEPILLQSATELAEKIRSGELTSERVVRAFIRRIQAVNPVINAVVDERYNAALEEARVADREMTEARGAGEEDRFIGRPLWGVPFTVKESCSLAGLSNAVGCLENAGNRAVKDGEAVRLLKASGAIPLLVSNTPELCLGWETSNLLNGTTCNPYCLNRTPGGSSGGEAALVASAATPFGVGSDIAGSIRLPAAFCGVYGHKPTPGIISIEGHIPTINDELYSRYLTVGPMSKHAQDLGPLCAIMAGERAPLLRLREPVAMEKLKVVYMTEAVKSIALIDVHGKIKEAVVKAAKYLESECGSYISKEKFQDLDDSVETSIAVFFSMKDIPNMLQDPANPKSERSLLVELIKYAFGGGFRSLQGYGFAYINKTNLFVPKSRRPYYHEKAKRLREQMERSLGDSGVFLYPAFSCPAYRHNEVFLRVSGVMYTMIFNILGFPATAVPCGLHEGLPISIQVVAAPNQDRLCLAVAEHLERCFGGWRPPS